MHLEMPLETKRLGQHLVDCLHKNGEVFDDTMEQQMLDKCILPQTGDFLALLGDIFDGRKLANGMYLDYLVKQCAGYEAVFILAGNHEFYNGEHSRSCEDLQQLCDQATQALKGCPVVHFLNRNWVDLPGTQLRILGCTLWSHVPDKSADTVTGTLSDYRVIKVKRSDGTSSLASVQDTNSWHAMDLDWLTAQLQSAEDDGRRCVVLTHHAPSFHDTVPPHHASSPAASGFCTDLEYLLHPPVLAWLFGHTHWSSWQRFLVKTSTSTEGTLQKGNSNTSVGAQDLNGLGQPNCIVNGTQDCLRSGHGRHSQWKTLSGGQHGLPHHDDFTAEASICHFGRDVLVASNQLGYGAKGEHTHGRGSRCHPWLTLEINADGEISCLTCHTANLSLAAG